MLTRSTRACLVFSVVLAAFAGAASAQELIIRDASENELAIFTESGDLVLLEGILVSNATPEQLTQDPNVPEFLVMDGPDVVLRIDSSTGNCYIKGEVFENSTSLDTLYSAGTGASFDIRNSAGAVVTSIDSGGNVALTGALIDLTVNGHLLSLRVVGPGSVEYQDNGVPAVVTEASGPVYLVLDPPSSVLPLAAFPEQGVSEFWQWLSDDPALDQTYVPEYSFPVKQHTALTAHFVPEGTIEFVTVQLETFGNGATIPAPGEYRIPRYAGTELDCVEACQDAEPLPQGCGDCEPAQFRVTAVPAQDWFFWDWKALSLVEPVRSAQAEIAVEFDSSVLASFVERPGLAELDLLADLAAFLVATNQIAAPADLYDLDVDWGDFWVETDRSLQYIGNGMPDAAEFALLEAILKDPHLDFSPRGGVAHIAVWNYYTRNLEQAQLELPAAGGAVTRAVAAYMTLGSYGHQRRAAAFVDQYFSVTLDLNAYTQNAMKHLGPDRDPDRDRLSNLEEWENAYASMGGDPHAALATFAAAALDPEDGGLLLLDGAGAKMEKQLTGDCE